MIVSLEALGTNAIVWKKFISDFLKQITQSDEKQL